jgi:hypothetical protein
MSAERLEQARVSPQLSELLEAEGTLVLRRRPNSTEKNDDGDRGDHELPCRCRLSNDPRKPRSHRSGHCFEVRLEVVIARDLHHGCQRKSRAPKRAAPPQPIQFAALAHHSTSRPFAMCPQPTPCCRAGRRTDLPCVLMSSADRIFAIVLSNALLIDTFPSGFAS